MAHAYDLNETKSGTTVRWFEKTLDLCVDQEVLDRTGPLGLPALADAGEAWGGIVGVPRIRVTAGMEGACDGYIHWVEPWAGKKETIAYTATSYGPITGELHDTDVYINGDAKWSVMEAPLAAKGTFDFQSVMTHEFGHILGLADDREHKDAVMWPYTPTGKAVAREISEDDAEGVRVAYERDRVFDLRTTAAAVAGCQAAPLAADQSFASCGWVLALCALVARRKRG